MYLYVYMLIVYSANSVSNTKSTFYEILALQVDIFNSPYNLCHLPKFKQSNFIQFKLLNVYIYIDMIVYRWKSLNATI